jgi:hypothetical protein
MRKSIVLMPLAFAASLAAAGCSLTPANDGAGFELLTPSAATRQFIVSNDQPFARQVAGHNRTGNSQPGCRK